MGHEMRVLVLGATGTIGSPVVRELIRSGHEVLALARSDASALKIAKLGARPVAGDIAMPEQWLATLPPLDGVIHAAAAFSSDDETIERQLLRGLLPFLSASRREPRFIYTGGCWLYGQSGLAADTEESPFAPLPQFAWGVPHSQLVLQAPGIWPIIIHPAMVYEPSGGVFGRFHTEAQERDAVRIVGAEHVRWPLVHAEDLATLYRLALERSAERQSYLGAAIEAMPVGRIARAFARRYGTRSTEPQIITADVIAAELGEWARGYGLDQRQSGDKARRLLGWQPRHLDPETEIALIG
jgi:nucleoside-diphosphate-sugar epimerase